MRSSLARKSYARDAAPQAQSRASSGVPERSRIAKLLTLVAMSLGYGVVRGSR